MLRDKKFREMLQESAKIIWLGTSIIMIVFVLISLGACAPKDGDDGRAGARGQTGISGSTGLQGLSGADGAQGLAGAQGVQGIAGADGLNGAQGLQGLSGTNGAQGAKGQDGSSCSVLQLPNGAVINCTNGTSAIIKDGVNCKGKGKGHEK